MSARNRLGSPAEVVQLGGESFDAAQEARKRDAAPTTVDVVILTAVKPELDAVLALGNDWQELRDRRGLRYYRREVRRARDSFVVAAAWIGDMGGRSAAIRAQQLLTELSPSCLAMCGICAGDQKKVGLGDIIVADRLFAWDEGKRVAEPGKQDEFYHALKSFDLKADWRMDAAFLASEINIERWSKERPPSKEAQRNWLLHTLAAFEAGHGPPPAAHPERKQRCPAWTAMFDALLAEGLFVLTDEGSLSLTADGRKLVARDKLRYPDGLPPEPPLRVQVGAMATVSAVIEDPGIFKKMQHVVRSTLGLEMEGVALGEVAERFDKRVIVVKAVQDFADGTKNDDYRVFGCRVSAEFLFAFLEKHFDPEHRRDERFRDKHRDLHFEGRGFEHEREREHPFLTKVERATSVRFPTAKITKHRVDAPFVGLLELDIEAGGLSGMQLVAALDQGITPDLVQKFALLERPFRDDYPPLRSTIVYRGDAAPSALIAEARRKGIHLETFYAFQALFDLTKYLEWQTARLQVDPVYPPAMYVDAPATVEVQGSRERTAVDNALRYMLDLLREAEQPRFGLVIGEFGAGKTFLLHELARRMVVEKHPVWPVLVEMHRLEKQTELSALLAAHFSVADVPGYSFKAFRYMLDEGRIALLFDGFDELAGHVTYDAVTRHFETVLGATTGPRAKVVLSSRRQHFLSDAQIKAGVQQAQIKLVLADQAARVPGFRLVMLEPFAELQIRQYLGNVLGDEGQADERYALIRDVQDLLGLSHNPRMLGFIARIPENALREAKSKQGTITAAGLYDLLVKDWLDFEHQRSLRISVRKGISRAALDKGMLVLALSMWHERVKHVSAEQLGDVLTAAMQALGEPALDPNVIAQLFGSGSLLVRDVDRVTEGRFSFVHRSVMEWFVAREAAVQVHEHDDSALLVVDELSPLMADFFHSMATREKAIAWARGKLLAREKGPVAKNATLVLQRLGESFELLDFAGQDLRGRDFSGVDWRGADLSGANLEGATLVGANLSGANLVGARLYRANLTNAKLIRAQLDGTDLRVARLVKADLIGAEGLDSVELFRTNFAGANLPAAFDPAAVDTFGVASVLGQTEPAWAGAAAVCASVAWDATGELLAAGFADGTVRIFDAISGELLRVLAGHTGPVNSVAFGPDGKTLASGSYDNTVRLWDASSGRPLLTLNGHENWVLSVAFCPDGKTLASGSDDNTVRLWDASSGRTLRTLYGHSNGVSCVAFGRDGNTLVTGSRDKTVRIWDVASGQCVRVLEGHLRAISSVAVSPDGNIVASGSDDKTVRLWNTTTGRFLHTLEGHPTSVRSVAFSPDGKIVASGSDDETVRLWDAASGRFLRAVEGHQSSVRSVAFGPDGKTLASGSYDNTVRLWEASSGRPLLTLNEHEDWVRSVAFSPDGKTVAAGSDDKTVRLWDASFGRSLRVLEAHEESVLSVAFSPDGKTVASGSPDETVRVWDTSSGRSLRALEGHQSAVLSVAFAPDGKTVASGSDDWDLRLWDVASGRCLHVLKGHSDPVTSVAFAPDGQTLASGSSDETLRLWDVASGQLLYAFPGHSDSVTSVVFGPAGKTIVSASADNTLRLWDVARGRCLSVLEGHADAVKSVALGPGGKTIASGSRDHTVRVWDIASAQCLLTFVGHTGPVRTVAYSPDGKTLASGSSDGTIRLWNVADGVCLGILLATTNGWVAFTPDGRYKYDGNVGGSFWHVAGLCRFELGDLPELQLPETYTFLG